MKKIETKVKGYISSTKDDFMTEQFKGETSDKLIRWPKELGVEHPFNFEDCEKVYTKFGLVSGIIDKTADHIVGEFSVESKYPKVVDEINDFIKKNNFAVVLREWIREALIKGNGFMEVNTKTGDCRVINANDMYVVRNRRGEVTGYNQYIGDKEKFNQKKVISFTPNQIAHLPIKGIAGNAYGLGMVYPNERVIENIVLTSQDLVKLMSRKAGAPIHAKFGIPGEAVNPSDIDAMKASMQYMTNRTEWATDANVEFKVIDFGPIGEKLTGLLEHLIKELCAGMDVPEVLLNSGQLNEGIAKVQLAGWDRKIAALQDLIESVIVQKIFKPYLENQGLSAEDVDFIWNLPGEEQINLRLTQLNTILGNMSSSENLKRLVQLEIARLLNIQEANIYLPQPEKGLDEQAFTDKQDASKMSAGLEPANNKPFVSPEDAKAKDKEKTMSKTVPVTKSDVKQMQCEHTHIKEELIDMETITLKDWLCLKEAAGFTYSDYLAAILKETKIDKFENLRAITEEDIAKGLFPQTDIEKLRTILKEGFRRNQTLRQIEQNIKDRINIRDRITETGNTIPGESRAESIARTETLRLSANAIYNLYEENGIRRYQFLSSPGACEICQSLDNGEVKLLTDAVDEVNYPPIHPSCRCFPVAVR